MVRFGKRPKDVVGADGQTYVHVPTEQVERYVVTLCESVIARVHDEPLPWVQLALEVSFRTVVDRMRGFETTATLDHGRVAFSAAKMGYTSRLVEFADIDQCDGNVELGEVMTFLHGAHHFGDGWYPTATGMAYTLVGHCLDRGDDPEVAHLIAPVGAGFDVRRRMCARQLAPLLDSSEATGGASGPELARCWYYGYYLRGCEMSLPEGAKSELSEANAD